MVLLRLSGSCGVHGDRGFCSPELSGLPEHSTSVAEAKKPSRNAWDCLRPKPKIHVSTGHERTSEGGSSSSQMLTSSWNVSLDILSGNTEPATWASSAQSGWQTKLFTTVNTQLFIGHLLYNKPCLRLRHHKKLSVLCSPLHLSSNAIFEHLPGGHYWESLGILGYAGQAWCLLSRTLQTSWSHKLDNSWFTEAMPTVMRAGEEKQRCAGLWKRQTQSVYFVWKRKSHRLQNVKLRLTWKTRRKSG